jgi:hypothetical protein
LPSGGGQEYDLLLFSWDSAIPGGHGDEWLKLDLKIGVSTAF